MTGAMLANDLELWRAVARGSDDAFSTLFERHHRAVYNYCFRRVADWATAEDLMATVFLEAWRRRRDVRLSGDSLLPWLLGVATNVIRNDRRSKRRGSAAVARLRPDAVAHDATDDLAARIDDQRRMADVLARLNHLSDGERDVVALVAWSEMSYEDASLALGIPIGTVRSRLSRARARLREPDAPTGHVPDDTTLARVSDAETRRVEA